MNYEKKIANEILQQIRALTPTPVLWSWGASKWQIVKGNLIKGIGEDYLAGLKFYCRGRIHKGHVLVTLAGNDTYTVTIGHVRKGVIKPIKQIKEVYFDELSNTIDELIEKQDNYQF